MKNVCLNKVLILICCLVVVYGQNKFLEVYHKYCWIQNFESDTNSLTYNDYIFFLLYGKCLSQKNSNLDKLLGCCLWPDQFSFEVCSRNDCAILYVV